MEILSKLNWVDILVIILMIRISYVGFQEGLSHEVFPVISAFLTTIVGLRYYAKIGAFISENIVSVPLEVSNFSVFLTLTAAVALVLKALKVFLNKIISVRWHPFLEHVGGIIFGVARASIVTSLVLMNLALLPLPYMQWSIRDKSVTGMHFLKIGPNVYHKALQLLPTIGVGGPVVDKDVLIESLAADKAIAPQARKTEESISKQEKR